MQIIYTSSARHRLQDIWEFNSKASSPEKADVFECRLFDRAKELLQNPKKGPPEKRLAKRGLGHRSLLLDRIKIIYRIEEEKILITDFFDSKQHPSRMRG